MSDDPRKVRPLSEKMPGKPFALAKDDKGLVISTKDNVQSVIPPPRVAFSPQPQLAPYGMAGVRLEQDAKRWMEAKKMEAPAPSEARTYKPFVPRGDKSRDFSR